MKKLDNLVIDNFEKFSIIRTIKIIGLLMIYPFYLIITKTKGKL